MRASGKKVMWLYRINTVRWSGKKGHKTEEFVVSDSLEKVWEYLALDRQDEGVEIESITRAAPVLKVL
jgi:hypothetical protein